MSNERPIVKVKIPNRLHDSRIRQDLLPIIKTLVREQCLICPRLSNCLPDEFLYVSETHLELMGFWANTWFFCYQRKTNGLHDIQNLVKQADQIFTDKAKKHLQI